MGKKEYNEELISQINTISKAFLILIITSAIISSLLNVKTMITLTLSLIGYFVIIGRILRFKMKRDLK